MATAVRSRARVAGWIAANAACVLVVALPDDDERIFSVSDLHGPSVVDAIGATGLVLLWIPVMMTTGRSFRRLDGRTRLVVFVIGVVLAGALTVSILGDLGWWWLPPAALLAVLQLWVWGHA